MIVEKRFEQSYRVRPQAAALVEDRGISDGSGPGARATAGTPEIAVSAWIAQATYRPYQLLDLRLDVAVASGLHVYGRPIPDGYIPLSVEIDPLDSLELLGPPQWPDGRPFRVAGLEESFVVHEGTVQGTVRLYLARNIGDVELVTRLRYQACSADECFPPDEVVLRLPLEGLDNIR
ncbi:MAG: protein-disulfide reductase DsbD domain-containing protein [Chloroflexota bacterium]